MKEMPIIKDIITPFLHTISASETDKFEHLRAECS
jgi:hypothetical protein